MKMMTFLVVLVISAVSNPISEAKHGEKAIGVRVRVWRSFYCATGAGCHNPICGGHLKTAAGRDARLGYGCAVDPRAIPYGSRLHIGGRVYVADDTGSAMRKDYKRGVVHVDIRVAGMTHEQVGRLGAGWVDAIIERRN
jgi:3D (Asp-Asp-Asp) domain-containing protein